MTSTPYTFNHELAAFHPSLCISRVFANVTRERIIRCFEILLNADNCIERVDRIHQKSKDGHDFWRVYIHFNNWPNTPTACELRARVLNGEICKVVYDDPWWWNVSESKASKPRHQDGVRPPPYLVSAEYSSTDMQSVVPPRLTRQTAEDSWCPPTRPLQRSLSNNDIFNQNSNVPNTADGWGGSASWSQSECTPMDLCSEDDLSAQFSQMNLNSTSSQPMPPPPLFPPASESRAAAPHADQSGSSLFSPRGWLNQSAQTHTWG